MVELKSTTSVGVGTVTLQEVRHVPKVRANLFALRRATDARARITIEGRTATFKIGGAVCMMAAPRRRTACGR